MKKWMHNSETMFVYPIHKMLPSNAGTFYFISFWVVLWKRKHDPGIISCWRSM